MNNRHAERLALAKNVVRTASECVMLPKDSKERLEAESIATKAWETLLATFGKVTDREAQKKLIREARYYVQIC